MTKAVIFDFFGVIGRSTYAMLAEKYHYTAEQHAALFDLHKALDAGFVSQSDFLTQYAETIGVSHAEFERKFAEVEAQMGVSTAVLGYVDELRRNFKTGLLSNVSSSSYRFIQPIVSHFDAVVASYMVKMAKPDMAIYEHMAHALGVDVSECVMIDDSQVNCEGARAAGMNAVRFVSIGQLRRELPTLL